MSWGELVLSIALVASLVCFWLYTNQIFKRKRHIDDLEILKVENLIHEDSDDPISLTPKTLIAVNKVLKKNAARRLCDIIPQRVGVCGKVAYVDRSRGTGDYYYIAIEVNFVKDYWNKFTVGIGTWDRVFAAGFNSGDNIYAVGKLTFEGANHMILRREDDGESAKTFPAR